MQLPTIRDSSVGRAQALTELLAWLGPLAKSPAPSSVRRRLWVLRDGRPRGFRSQRGSGESRLESYVYTPPAAALGVYLLAPGLHFLGPDDPRLDRFCRVLARAGFVVVAPFLPAYTDLLVEESAVSDLRQVARAVQESMPQGQRLTLFSISFGSWPAFEVAASEADAIDGVITFGGYAEFDAAVRFCIDGRMQGDSGVVTLKRDPLNPPALFLNLLPFIRGVHGSPDSLAQAWREMAYRTWGRMELKAEGRLEPIAQDVVRSLPASQRELFLIGCGLRPGAAELVAGALDRSGAAFQFADPLRALARLSCPVVICHGRDDDVIPWGEAVKLERALVPRVATRTLITGLYGHTGVERPRPGELLREGVTLLEMARALAAAGRLREWV